MSDCSRRAWNAPKWDGVEFRQLEMVDAKESGESMSKAYICDKCGLIVANGTGMHEIWTVNPAIFEMVSCVGQYEHSFHLCGECYAQFESEYLANKRESEGAL